jgi:hypothetical protein
MWQSGSYLKASPNKNGNPPRAAIWPCFLKHNRPLVKIKSQTLIFKKLTAKTNPL